MEKQRERFLGDFLVGCVSFFFDVLDTYECCCYD
jgi:hypothetical protein